MWRQLCSSGLRHSAGALQAASAACEQSCSRLRAASLDQLPQRILPAQQCSRWFAAEPVASPEPPDEEAPRSPKCERIVEEILNLNLLETAELTALLQKRLGISPAHLAASFGPPQGGGLQAQAAPAELEKPPEEKTEFDVKLQGYEASAKIKIIKEIRGITALGLKEAKDLVEKAPVVVKASLKKEEADELVKKLEAVGAKMVLE